MPHSFDQWLTLVFALIGAVQSWRAHTKATEGRDHAAATADAVEALAETHPGAVQPGAPGVSLTQLIRFWDLLSKIISFWGGFKAAPVGTLNEVPLIKTKIDGRHCEIGPTPVRFTD